MVWLRGPRVMFEQRGLADGRHLDQHTHTLQQRQVLLATVKGLA